MKEAAMAAPLPFGFRIPGQRHDTPAGEDSPSVRGAGNGDFVLRWKQRRGTNDGKFRV